MAERKLLRRVEELEQEQREHYAEHREEHGNAIGETICSLVSEARAQGLCLPDGRPSLTDLPDVSKPPRRKPAS